MRVFLLVLSITFVLVVAVLSYVRRRFESDYGTLTVACTF